MVAPAMVSAPLTHAAYRATPHFRGLDGLRCVGVLAVIWHHSYRGSALMLQRSFLGVDLFLVLSGFLIVTLLLRERAATGTIALGRFWLRRCVRLMPPFYLMLVLLALFYAARGPSAHGAAFFAALPANALYLSNWVKGDAINLSVLWSLATEEQFYLVWPLVELLAHAIAWPILLLLMLANQAMNFGLLDATLAGLLPRPLAQYEIVAATYMPVCLGVALARLLHAGRSFGLLRILLGHAIAPWMMLAAIGLLFAFAPADIAGWPRLAIQLLMAGLLGAIVLRPAAPLVGLLERAPIVRIGTVSYGMYLYHLWVMHAAGVLLGRTGEGALLFPLTALLSWGLAELSYRTLERPLQTLARRHRPRRIPAPDPLPAE